MHNSDSRHSAKILESRPRPIQRKSSRGRWLIGASLLLLVLVMLILVVKPLLAQAPPGLSIALTATNPAYVEIKVTNAPAGAQYELQRVNELDHVLEPGFVWPTPAGGVGVIGQTNFVMDMGIFQMGYFRVSGCVDCDGDGVPNWQDGNPFNTNVLGLTITIDNPLNGANIQ